MVGLLERENLSTHSFSRMSNMLVFFRFLCLCMPSDRELVFETSLFVHVQCSEIT